MSGYTLSQNVVSDSGTTTNYDIPMIADTAAWGSPPSQTPASTVSIRNIPSKSAGYPSYNGKQVVHDGMVPGVLAKEDSKTNMLYYEFQFFPSEMKFNYEAGWEIGTPAGSIKPYGSFQHMNPPTVEFDIMVDDTENNQYYNNLSSGVRVNEGRQVGVQADIDALLGFLGPNVRDSVYDKSGPTGKYISPTPVWLSFNFFVTRCLLTAVNPTITMWTPSLVPVRATIGLKFTMIGTTAENEFTMLKHMQEAAVNSKIVTNKNPQGSISLYSPKA